MHVCLILLSPVCRHTLIEREEVDPYMKAIQTIDKILTKIIVALLMLSVAAMVLLTGWQVLCRYVILISVPYAEELARLAIVWCIYFGAALAVRFREHMCVVALTNVLPKPAQLGLKLIMNALILYLGYVMIVHGIEHVQFTATDVTTSLGYHRNVFYLPAPIAGTLICLYTAANMVGDCMSFRKKEDLKSGESPDV